MTKTKANIPLSPIMDSRVPWRLLTHNPWANPNLHKQPIYQYTTHLYRNTTLNQKTKLSISITQNIITNNVWNRHCMNAEPSPMPTRLCGDYGWLCDWGRTRAGKTNPGPATLKSNTAEGGVHSVKKEVTSVSRDWSKHEKYTRCKKERTGQATNTQGQAA